MIIISSGKYRVTRLTILFFKHVENVECRLFLRFPIPGEETITDDRMAKRVVMITSLSLRLQKKKRKQKKNIRILT